MGKVLNVNSTEALCDLMCGEPEELEREEINKAIDRAICDLADELGVTEGEAESYLRIYLGEFNE